MRNDNVQPLIRDILNNASAPKLTDLGCANGWGSREISSLTKCRALGHIMTETTIGRCYTKYECLICGIFYTEDSGD